MQCKNTVYVKYQFHTAVHCKTNINFPIHGNTGIQFTMNISNFSPHCAASTRVSDDRPTMPLHKVRIDHALTLS